MKIVAFEIKKLNYTLQWGINYFSFSDMVLFDFFNELIHNEIQLITFNFE